VRAGQQVADDQRRVLKHPVEKRAADDHNL
jgi:hypothetical protein